jgi:hypothetical protein
MNSPNRKLMAAVIFALGATAFGASAQTAGSESRQFEAFETQESAAPGSVPDYTPSEHAAKVSTPRSAKPESRQFEIFENNMSVLSAPSYTPSEHPNAKPAPRSKITASPFNASDLASPGG